MDYKILSKREYELWKFYTDFLEEKGVPPKRSEAAIFMKTTPQYISIALRLMENKGYMIKLEPPTGRKMLQRGWMPTTPQINTSAIRYLKEIKQDFYDIKKRKNKETDETRID